MQFSIKFHKRQKRQDKIRYTINSILKRLKGSEKCLLYLNSIYVDDLDDMMKESVLFNKSKDGVECRFSKDNENVYFVFSKRIDKKNVYVYPVTDRFKMPSFPKDEVNKLDNSSLYQVERQKDNSNILMNNERIN